MRSCPRSAFALLAGLAIVHAGARAGAEDRPGGGPAARDTFAIQPLVPGIHHRSDRQALERPSREALAYIARTSDIELFDAVEAMLQSERDARAARRFDDVWERVRAGFAMPDLLGETVAARRAWYAGQPELLGRVTERGRRYLYHIVEEIERRGLPTELALLPILESGFDPMALSPAQASGLWQFVPSTGKAYKLEQNRWFDARRDVVASTAAALDHLADLYRTFADWRLALAAYNWGENAVARAIERNLARGLPADYGSLVLPDETRLYVPRLQALKDIVSAPARHGIDLPPIPNQPYFVGVEAGAPLDERTAAGLAELPLSEFRALNPAWNLGVIAGAPGFELLVPPDRAERFARNLGALRERLALWKAYRPRRGESIEAIAMRFGVEAELLRSVNRLEPGAAPPPGRALRVPAGAWR